MAAPDAGGGSGVPGALLLFLSHAGADTEAAPEARAAGLRVWFDKDDLHPGEGWQAQLEEAVGKRASAFRPRRLQGRGELGGGRGAPGAVARDRERRPLSSIDVGTGAALGNRASVYRAHA